VTSTGLQPNVHLPSIPHVLLATHKTKANIFYFSFREATSLSPQHRSIGRHPVKKALTEGAWPPSVAEERKQREDSEPRGPAPCPLFPQIQESRPPRVPSFPKPPASQFSFLVRFPWKAFQFFRFSLIFPGFLLWWSPVLSVTLISAMYPIV